MCLYLTRLFAAICILANALMSLPFSRWRGSSFTSGTGCQRVRRVVDYCFTFIYFTPMLTGFINRAKILSLVTWSFFSFSAVKVLSIFLYTINHIFLWYACSYSLLLFFYYFAFKKQFGTRLTYLQYTANNILFVILITLFSYVYYKVIMLNDDSFAFNLFLLILISNLLLGSFLFLFTLIKKK